MFFVVTKRNCSYFPAMLKRPFRCPADHVFDLNAMERHKLPVLEAGFWDRRPAGAPADVRVHVCGARPTAGVPASPSLAALAATAGSGELADALAARCRAVEKRAAGAGGEGASARVSAFRAVNANVAATAAAAAGRGEADVSAAAEAARAALVPRGLSDAQLEQVLEPLSMFPSLAFDSTDGVFGGFEKGNNARAFKEVLERSLGMQWCCTPRGGFRFNFTAGADCASEGRVSIAEPRPNDRTLVCEGARPASGGR
ncbi:hypothetical protein T492DRAFT_1022330 [Pavlovales sp. CCMP2436]|nr:hypothetical protein T492DRAFT_1022330 [Pavlovales sp. CCMP2436]